LSIDFDIKEIIFKFNYVDYLPGGRDDSNRRTDRDITSQTDGPVGKGFGDVEDFVIWMAMSTVCVSPICTATVSWCVSTWLPSVDRK
jgi:hypothetical protein